VPNDPTKESSPGSLPESTPPRYPMTDYSFTLQVVMELQKSVGALTEAVNTLKVQGEKHATKLDSISHRIYAFGAIIAIVAFVANIFAPSLLAGLKAFLK
jgi:hypothetical protein